ncbi:hypothetical protein BCON_0014g00750 [Botryotinia convoluta]|uniref:Uncharacterized protein n=1 Tax=Botryotinia convoluta TaxID=54673 RepID=A0A4Z1IPM0_9HELO|nr:hypothetical protein BCON_0014g00750 [Botryotinia convoluta]
MFAPSWRSAPSPLRQVLVHPDREEIEKKVEDYERIRLDLRNKSASTAYKKAKEAWKAHIDKDTWKNHGLITRRLEEAYLSTRARLDIGGNNAKESETCKEGSRTTSGQFTGYITVHMLQQPLMMIEAKRHPKGREYMTPAELTALEDQVEKYCRQWLKDNPDIPFLYAVTRASTEMRFWIMERNRDMERAKMVRLWESKERTRAEYRDPGLECDAEIVIAAIDLIKDNPNGSDQAVTTTSDSQSQSDRAPSAVPSRATRGTSGSRRGTPSGDGRGDRTRSRDRRNNRSDDQPSSQEETPRERSERHRRRERAKESERSERSDEEKGKGKEPKRPERGDREKESEKESRSERGNREKDRGERRESSEKSRSLQPSAPIDVSRSTSRGDPRRSNTSIDERGKLASGSSPEYTAQIPIRERDRRERGDTDRGERERVYTKEGKGVEACSSSKTTESRKRDFQTRRTDSLSTVPPTSSDDRNSSSSDNRAPRPKVIKKVEDASADTRRRSKRDKPSGSG